MNTSPGRMLPALSFRIVRTDSDMEPRCTGTWGALATGIFATDALVEGSALGLLAGNPSQFVSQLVSVIVVLIYSLVITFVLLKVLDGIMGLRVTEQEEQVGLDISEHGERAYA